MNREMLTWCSTNIATISGLTRLKQGAFLSDLRRLERVAGDVLRLDVFICPNKLGGRNDFVTLTYIF
jgi:hypothetical protein